MYQYNYVYKDVLKEFSLYNLIQNFNEFVVYDLLCIIFYSYISFYVFFNNKRVLFSLGLFWQNIIEHFIERIFWSTNHWLILI